MTPEEFRQAGHALIDWLADYRSSLERLPVRSQVAPGEIKNRLPAQPPASPESLQQLLQQLERDIVPGITQVQHPMHFGWFPSNASLASVLGDIAGSGLGTLGISWESCPALTEVEQVTCDWMRQLVGLSPNWHGTIYDTASTASLVALLVARERLSDYAARRGGLQAVAHPLVVYMTEQTHSSANKAALLAGYGQDNIRLVAADPVTRAMSAAALAAAIQQDQRAQRCPTVVVATVGSTGITAIDPVADIVDVAAQHGIWVHVDAALAGSAMLLPEYRHLWHGVEGADSLSWNPHKWMGTVLDCALFYVREPEYLLRVMSTDPSYLRSGVDDQVVQYRDWGIPLGRRFRALKLWFHLKLDGCEAIRQRLRRDLENARWLAAQIQQTPDWQLLAPVTLQTVCCRHQPDGLTGAALERHTLAWLEAINRSGRAFMSPGQLDDQWLARVSIGVESTTREHVASLWQIMRAAAENTRWPAA